MATDVSNQKFPFSLPDLPYAYEALEPSIDKQTMQIHHDKHHKTYVDKLNEAVEKEQGLHSMTLTELLRDLAKLPESIRTAVKNNGGGHLNHDFFWNIMGPPSKAEPGGALAAAIAKSFGTFADFKKRFGDTSGKHFASGWVALAVANGTQMLEIVELSGHEVVDSRAKTGVLILDVWEHAYYLKYQNRRPDFIAAWWNVVNWASAERRFERGSAAR